MALSGIKHTDIGTELSKSIWELESSHEIVHGSAFPTVPAPVEPQLFYRDDLHIWYIYSSGVWAALTAEEFTTIASSATPTPTGGSLKNFFTVTALAEAATFAVPSGTPVLGNRLVIRIKDNATARDLGWNAVYRAIGVALPTTTTLSKTMYLGFIYNYVDSKWDLLASNIQG